MPDHKETGREPTERERETAFAPHHSPARQGDGDPGRKSRPAIERDQSEEEQTAETEKEGQADGEPR